jgi:predicted TIM-barrel fold metal-dependent hydrolase
VNKFFSDGSWDCHAHVIEANDRYPMAPGRSYDPPAAPLEEYLALLDRLGLDRGVLVQPSVYGFDNRCMLDALEEAGDRLRGVAVPAPGTRARELESMHRRGIRAVRCNLLNPGGLDPATVLGWQEPMEEMGWHLQLHLDIEELGDLGSFLHRFRIPLVFDHMGRSGASRVRSQDRPGPGEGGPGLHQLLERVKEGACFVKLSAPYRLSETPAPWEDVIPLARSFLLANPGRCVWGTDWPHVDTEEAVREEDLLAALEDWCQDDVDRPTFVNEAPEHLYGGD